MYIDYNSFRSWKRVASDPTSEKVTRRVRSPAIYSESCHFSEICMYVYLTQTTDFNPFRAPKLLPILMLSVVKSGFSVVKALRENM